FIGSSRGRWRAAEVLYDPMRPVCREASTPAAAAIRKSRLWKQNALPAAGDPRGEGCECIVYDYVGRG
ncbi:MAG: hypothetical protein H6Q78_1043, partial [Candidatus Krumholzibacteriota bacterium]|nr:hypothetical protein [Candidatus Krumholzibacteriota bacterium]